MEALRGKMDEIFDITALFDSSAGGKDGGINTKPADKTDEIIDITALFDSSAGGKDGRINTKPADKTGEIIDITALFSSREGEKDAEIKRKPADKTDEIIDITALFDSSAGGKDNIINSAPSDKTVVTDGASSQVNTSDIIQCYDDEIPAENLAYKLFPDKIRGDLLNKCNCKHQCSSLLLQDQNIVCKVQHFRSEYHTTKQGNERSTKTLRLIRDTICDGCGKNRKNNFQGIVVCTQKWLDLLSISRATYYRALSCLKQGYIAVDTVKKDICHNYRGLSAIGFIENFLDEYGDPSPEREVILLPDCITIKYIFDEYKNSPCAHVQERCFYKLFQENFEKIVSFSKTKNINPCDICMKVKLELHKLKDVKEKDKLKSDLKIHLERQRKERRDYYKKKGEAIMKPSEALSLIIDGMDQSKTNIPHFKGWTRPKCGSVALKTHITGCLVHGKKLHLFTDLLQWPHDPNLTLTCLIKAITSENDCLPPKLYVQCDNCGRENKNRYVIGFLGYLCLAGYIKEAYLSFLIKGHTHEDIDQRFSKISHRLRQVNALTLPELQAEVKNSFIENPAVEALGCVWDVKEWLEPILCDMSAHSYQHQFWLYCDRPNHVAMKYRRFSTDQWQPADDVQLELFELNLSGVHVFPRGNPKYVSPLYEEGRFQAIKAAIEKMKSFLSFKQYTWWNDFLKDQNKIIKLNVRWPLMNLRKAHKVLDIPMQLTDNVEPSAISDMVTAEGTTRVVATKRKKRKRTE